MAKLWLPEKFKRERSLLHTSSDGKKQCVSMVFAVSHLIGVTFAPRIKDFAVKNLTSLAKIKSELEHKGYPIKPTYYVNENKIKRNWNNILRLIAAIKLREHRAPTILKRLGEYSNQHRLQEALKEFGRIIKSIFILKYIDDME